MDSTGLKLCGAGEWLTEKHGAKTRRFWRKLHLGFDADTGASVHWLERTKRSDLTDKGTKHERHAALRTGSGMTRSGLIHAVLGSPDVIAGEVDVLPSERGEVGQQVIGHLLDLAQRGHGAYSDGFQPVNPTQASR